MSNLVREFVALHGFTITLVAAIGVMLVNPLASIPVVLAGGALTYWCELG